jgi:thiol-disulfide isomerase/thioredoxin
MTTKKMFFTAESCAACKTMYSTAVDAGFEIVSLDTDEGVDIANQHNVRGLPTFLVFDDIGTIVFRHVGTIPKEELRGHK